MNQPPPIPKLDLAPKLNRPLSLWNPLDYLRLLYWVFFFPQAVRWYEKKYGIRNDFYRQSNFLGKIDIAIKNSTELKFLIQSIILISFSAIFIGITFDFIGFSVNWIGIIVVIILCIIYSISDGIVFGTALCLVFSYIHSSPDFNIGLGFFLLGVLSNVAFIQIKEGIVTIFVRSVAFGFISGMTSTFFGVSFGIVGGLVTSIASWRPESWIIGSLLNFKFIQNRSWLFPRATAIPIPFLSYRLKIWLKQDWSTGLENSNELLKYTFQFIPVVEAVNHVLARLSSEEIIFKVSQLASISCDWELVKFASASLRRDLLFNTASGFLVLLNFLKIWRQKWRKHFVQNTSKMRLNTKSRAAAAGFWYLHKKEPEQAMEAFAVVRNLRHGEEMFLLAQTLAQLNKAEKPNTIAEIELPNFPPEPLLRPITWNALNGLRSVVEDVKLVLGGTSKSARSFALNRAIGELKQIIDDADKIPKVEQGLIVEISQTWTTALEGIALDIGKISITERVQNPYVIGDPVEGSLFVGRDDIMRQLEELWVINQDLQSVAIYGHRRMGKTSILRNIANRSGAEITVVYINLQRLGTVSEGIGEVLMAISDGISDALGVPPPEDEALLRLPQRTFERYLTQVVREMNQKGLIIALDEFEMIEELIKAGQIPSNFMGVLRGLVQMSSKVAFVFAGLHTLEEMTEDYFQPFFASVIPIRVGFLKPASTRQILSLPNDDFLLDYTGEALDLIHHLTAGQPYLVQLVGFLLVRRYNEQVFELGQSRNSTFTVEDVEAVINDSEFFNRGRYYFTGVWNQAAQGSPKQQDILTVLAEYPDGFSIDKLAAYTGLEETILNDALNTLKRHDVVCETGNHWKIIVELFRRWVENRSLYSQ